MDKQKKTIDIFHIIIILLGILIIIFGICLDTQDIQEKLLVTTVGICFFVIGIVFPILRWNSLKRYSYHAGFGIWVDFGNFPKSDLKNYVREIIIKHERVYPKAREYLSKNVILVEFVPGPIPNPMNPKKMVNGYVIRGGEKVVVAYSDYQIHNGVRSTSFEHEIGHIIQGHGSNNWVEVHHHAEKQEQGWR